MKRLALAIACAVFLLPVLAIAAGTGVVADSIGHGTVTGPVADIPPRYMQLYQAAAARYRLPWELLAAVGKVECDHGRLPHPSCRRDGAENYAGAGGPMQFLAATWTAYGVDADRDGHTDRWNPADAIFGAANYLRSSGAPGDLQRAIYAYNHSGYYVHQVTTLMEQYRREASATPPGGGVDLGDGVALAHAVLSNPRIELPADAVLDVRSGRVDPRLLAALLALSERFTLGGVGPFVAGHSKYVAGTSVLSNHAGGRAVDIGAVDGQLVRASSPATRHLVMASASLPASIRPTEIGSPFALTGCGACFADADHQDHVHLGFDA
jgi:hypothetical protein